MNNMQDIETKGTLKKLNDTTRGVLRGYVNNGDFNYKKNPAETFGIKKEISLPRVKWLEGNEGWKTNVFYYNNHIGPWHDEVIVKELKIDEFNSNINNLSLLTRIKRWFKR